MMRFLTVLLLVCSALIYVKCENVQKEKIKAAIATCKEEQNVSEDDSAAEDEKCMAMCVMKKLEIMNTEGKLVKEQLIADSKLIADGDEKKEELLLEVVEMCTLKEVSENHCEAGEQYAHCLLEGAKKRDVETDE